MNTDYMIEQTRATTAFAGQLAVPIAYVRRIHFPIVA
jgi:hypothetical protein